MPGDPISRGYCARNRPVVDTADTLDHTPEAPDNSICAPDDTPDYTDGAPDDTAGALGDTARAPVGVAEGSSHSRLVLASAKLSPNLRPAPVS